MQPLSPTLWRTCRVIANDARLNLLRILFDIGEGTVTTLASRTNLSEPHASAHLRMLNSRGLISAHPSGKWVFYSAKANPAVEHAHEVLEALKISSSNPEITNADIIHAATAFTHARRISITRQLATGKKTGPELSIACRISPPALSRHLSKLDNRNLITFIDEGYILEKPPTPLSRVLLDIATA